MARNIDTALIRAFLAVSETGGMTAAAKQLHLTQAAISQQIKRLEEAFDLTLFEREKRTIHLTPAGERLLSWARQLIDLNDEIWGQMTAPEFEGEVKLGVPHDIVHVIVPQVLRQFDRAWPRVRVSIVCSNSPLLLKALEDGEIDLTLTTEQQGTGGGEILFTDRLVWAGAAGGVAREKRPLPIALGDQRCIFRPLITRALMNARRDWRSVCDDATMQALWATVEADLAITAQMACSLPDKIAILPTGDDLPSLAMFDVRLYMPKIGGTEIAEALAQQLRSVALESRAIAA